MAPGRRREAGPPSRFSTARIAPGKSSFSPARVAAISRTPCRSSVPRGLRRQRRVPCATPATVFFRAASGVPRRHRRRDRRSSAAAGSIRPGAAAAAVLAALLAWVEKRGVRLLTRRRVTRVSREPDDRFLVAGRFAERADRVVLAVGGASYPQTGSRGDGYRIAAALGHHIVAPRPALVPVVCREPFFQASRGPEAAQRQARRPPGRPPGHRSVRRGPRHAVRHLRPGGFPGEREIGALAATSPVPLLINLKPALDATVLDARIEREMNSLACRTTAAALATLLRGNSSRSSSRSPDSTVRSPR